MTKVNLEPTASLDSTRSCPPRFRTIRATTASPSPRADRERWCSSSPTVDTCSNSRKMDSSRASEIPHLEKRTVSAHSQNGRSYIAHTLCQSWEKVKSAKVEEEEDKYNIH